MLKFCINFEANTCMHFTLEKSLNFVLWLCYESCNCDWFLYVYFPVYFVACWECGASSHKYVLHDNRLICYPKCFSAFPHFRSFTTKFVSNLVCRQSQPTVLVLDINTFELCVIDHVLRGMLLWCHQSGLFIVSLTLTEEFQPMWYVKRHRQTDGQWLTRRHAIS